MSQRPISFVYNGGPGSSSIWLHMGAFGPRRVVTTDAGPTPPPPFKLVDNAECLLDKTDLVFVDPVGTGFSRAVGKAKDKDFWGIDQDVKSLAQLIATYIGRNGRWNSPKFLIGESYGTFRSAALANYLQQHNGMYFNGIDLISSVLDLSTISFPPGNDMPYVFYVPSYAAAASYNKMLKDQPADLDAFLVEARQFATTEYAGALMKGANLSAAEKAGIAKKLSRFTGLGEDYLIKADLRVKLQQFMAELQRARGLTTGRYDARFSGPEPDPLAEYVFNDAQSAAVQGAFVAAFNSYVREDLKFGKDLTYNTYRGYPRMGLEARPARPKVRIPRRTQRRAGLSRRPSDQHPPARRSRKRHLRPGHAVLRHRIHHDAPGPARKPAEKHQPEVLRRRPHDVFPRSRPVKAKGKRSNVPRQRHKAIAEK